MNPLLLATSLVLSASILTGCGGDDSSSPAGEPGTGTSTPERSEVNPVDVLSRIDGCVIPPGVTMGQADMRGNLYASCEIPELHYTSGGTAYTASADVTARAVDPDALADFGYDEVSSDDSHKAIFGDGFYVVITASPEVFGTGAVDVAAIATAVDGQVQ